METDKLKMFIAVAETQSFTKAAERLFVSHSTVSRAVSELENELGAALFERDNKVRGLTNAGKKLYSAAGELISLADKLRNEIGNDSAE